MKTESITSFNHLVRRKCKNFAAVVGCLSWLHPHSGTFKYLDVGIPHSHSPIFQFFERICRHSKLHIYAHDKIVPFDKLRCAYRHRHIYGLATAFFLQFSWTIWMISFTQPSFIHAMRICMYTMAWTLNTR